MHRHATFRDHTPFDVHHTIVEARNTARADVLTAYATQPQRFVLRPPTPARCQPPRGSIPQAATVYRRRTFNPTHPVDQTHCQVHRRLD
jgi:hypothetical protein